jgi:hypothetical protein
VANLDKLRPLLKPNWLSVVILSLAGSAFIGVVTRLFLALNDSVLQMQMEIETKAKEWFKDLDSQKPDWKAIQEVGRHVFKIAKESANIAASKQPLPFRWFSEWTIRKLDEEMEIGARRCFQIYWFSLFALGFQIACLALAILWPLIRLKAHVH